MTDNHVPPSEDVRLAQAQAEAAARTRRGIRRFYLGPAMVAAAGIATLWWTSVNPLTWWFSAITATFWVVWGTLVSTTGSMRAYQLGWTQSAAITVLSFKRGHLPPLRPPHLSEAGEVSKLIQKMADAGTDKGGDDQ